MDAAIIISLIALLATIYQAHLQRVHNEKSVKPLVQIDLKDRGVVLYIRVQNNGVGPFIVEKLTFTKAKQMYSRIEDCLDFDPKSYDHLEINAYNSKVLLPGGFLDIFSKEFEENEISEMPTFRHQLSLLRIQVKGRDIYNNKVIAEQNLHWFARHMTSV